MENPDVQRKRLRDKIRSKRNERLGTGDAVAANESMLKINDPATRVELSRRVETELRKVFGTTPDAMTMAQSFIDNPMAAVHAAMPSMSAEEKRAVDSLLKPPNEDDDEEAPPMQ